MKRLRYAIMIVSVIALGLLSRKVTMLPAETGDALWAVMIFLIFRFLFIKQGLLLISIWSLLLCYVVEFSQRYHAPWIDRIRSTTLGHLVLGQGFLWIDLLAYTIGIFCIAGLEYLMRNARNSKIETNPQ